MENNIYVWYENMHFPKELLDHYGDFKPIVDYSDYLISKNGIVFRKSLCRRIEGIVLNGMRSFRLKSDKDTWNMITALRAIAFAWLEVPVTSDRPIAKLIDVDGPVHADNIQWKVHVIEEKDDILTADELREYVPAKYNGIRLPRICLHPTGRVALVGGKRLALSMGSHGYYTFSCEQTNYLLHRAMASTFLPIPEKYKDVRLLDVNHKDSDRTNNNVDNLEWVSRRENIEHAIRNGLRNTSKIIATECVTGKEITFHSINDCARHFNINPGLVFERVNFRREVPVHVPSNEHGFKLRYEDNRKTPGDYGISERVAKRYKKEMKERGISMDVIAWHQNRDEYLKGSQT